MNHKHGATRCVCSEGAVVKTRALSRCFYALTPSESTYVYIRPPRLRNPSLRRSPMKNFAAGIIRAFTVNFLGHETREYIIARPLARASLTISRIMPEKLVTSVSRIRHFPSCIPSRARSQGYRRKFRSRALSLSLSRARILLLFLFLFPSFFLSFSLCPLLFLAFSWFKIRVKCSHSLYPDRDTRWRFLQMTLYFYFPYSYPQAILSAI